MSAAHDTLRCDVAVIGGGSAGYAAARITAEAGRRTVVIEGGPALGGLCILRGCMPSKALLYAAEVLHLARSGPTWGLRIPKAGFNFKAVMARKKAMVEEFAKYRRRELTGGKFQLLRACATFADPHTLLLTERRGRAPRFVAAKHFIICTGSVAAPLRLPGLDEAGFLTSDDAMVLPKLPRSLIVLGGGPVGVEMAQFFSRFDVEVTIVQRGRQLLRESDPDAAAALARSFEREGIRVFTGTELRRAFGKGRAKGVVFRYRNGARRVAAEEILVATGRIPATAGLGLEKIGVKTKSGLIATNARMQTSAPHIYAAGDCASPHQIVHIGVEQGELAARNIVHPGKRRSMDYRLLCEIVFTDPQVAHVGLTEKRARALKVPYLAARHNFNDHGKAMIMGTKHGFVKLLADPHSGEILGGACVGPLAGELIHEIIAAMRRYLTVAELAAMPHYHPTLAEIWTYPAAELAGKIG